MIKKVRNFYLILVSIFVVTGCGKVQENQQTEKEDSPKIALVLGFGGVDDLSFNQSSWEGLTAWAKKNDLIENQDFAYIETNEPQDNSTNINLAVDSGYDTIISLSYLQEEAIKEAATSNPELNFALIDAQVEGFNNVASVTFKDQESAYLAGIAAAYSTQTNKVGFIGGIEGPVIQRFETGFKQGVEDGAKKLGKEVAVVSQYAGSYDSSDIGKAIAASMYQTNADIIYQAAGSTGNGVFQEAKERSKNQENNQVWVIGVDRDQQKEGEYETQKGDSGNVTLTSTLKNVGKATADLAQAAYDEKFPGGKQWVLGLEEEGVGLTEGLLSKEAGEAVKQAKEKILSKELVISEK